MVLCPLIHAMFNGMKVALARPGGLTEATASFIGRYVTQDLLEDHDYPGTALRGLKAAWTNIIDGWRSNKGGEITIQLAATANKVWKSGALTSLPFVNPDEAEAVKNFITSIVTEHNKAALAAVSTGGGAPAYYGVFSEGRDDQGEFLICFPFTFLSIPTPLTYLRP